MTLRPGTFDDLPAAAGLRAGAVADAIITPEGMHTRLAELGAAADLMMLAAEVDGQVIGWCNGWRNTFGKDPGVGALDVIVAPDHQRRGLGGRLVARGLEHLEGIGIHTVRGYSVDGPAQRAIAARFGFVEVHASSIVRCRPAQGRAAPGP